MNEEIPINWTQRRPAKIQPEEALAKLQTALIRERKRFESATDGGQEAAQKAMTFVIHYLAVIGIPNPLLEPLLSIVSGLNDARGGTSSRILAIKRSGGGRPKKGIIDSARDGVIAAIAEGFQQGAKNAGWDHDTAMAEAAKAINAGTYQGELTGAQVKKIRERIGGDFDTIAKDQFDSLVKSAAFLADPLSFARLHAADPFILGRAPA